MLCKHMVNHKNGSSTRMEQILFQSPMFRQTRRIDLYFGMVCDSLILRKYLVNKQFEIENCHRNSCLPMKNGDFPSQNVSLPGRVILWVFHLHQIGRCTPPAEAFGNGQWIWGVAFWQSHVDHVGYTLVKCVGLHIEVSDLEGALSEVVVSWDSHHGLSWDFSCLI